MSSLFFSIECLGTSFWMGVIWQERRRGGGGTDKEKQEETKRHHGVVSDILNVEDSNL